MVTSTPDSPEGEANGSSPRYETLATVAEQVAAIDTLIELAKLSIRAFDIDLSRMGWNDTARAQMLSAFLRDLPGVVLLASHDRVLLDDVCTDLFDLDPRPAGGLGHGPRCVSDSRPTTPYCRGATQK